MFYALKVKEIKKETNDTVSILFDIPSDLKKYFQFSAGQYLTIKHVIQNEEIRRSYSICSAPYENTLRIAAKKIKDGLMSGFLNDSLKEGDELEVMAPMGNFIANIAKGKRAHVAFAAGSGITPIISIAKEVLKQEPKSEFNLYYGNKTVDSIIFKSELDELETEYKKIFGKRFKVYHYLSQGNASDQFFGSRINEDVLREAIRKHLRANHFYLCGPEQMILSARDILISKAIQEDQIHFELFTTSELSQALSKSNSSESSAVEGKAKVKVILDGTETEFEMDPKESVLHAAIDKGLDVPYACQGGTCCTCQALLVEGKVEMDMNMVLSDEEMEKGFVLTCQSHPTTDSIVVNYDES